MASKYASDEVEPDRPMRVCAEAGRKCVRNIHQYPILSTEWIQLVDSLKQLQRLVQLEGRMPGNAKVQETAGRDLQSDGTLWDQEGHENAIRILVEEAKVNLCLRIMNEFKVWHYGDYREHLAHAMQAHGQTWSEVQLQAKCVQFEEALGVLLWRALVHVEALQLMDIPLLIEHCAMILCRCFEIPPEQTDHSIHRQEMIVMYYCSALFKHAEALNNTELLAKVREHQLVNLVVAHIAKYPYPEDFAWDVALGLAALCDNEDFSTGWESFFDTPDGARDRDKMQAFLNLKGWVEPMLTSFEKKKDLRALTDFFNLLGRKMG